MEQILKTMLENVRAKTPLVHNITNYVTVNDVANVLLAAGGSPIMSDDADDVEDITSICGGLNINIGTLNKNTIPSMFLAGRKANELGHIVLLDPVGAGASRLRTDTANRLMREVRFDAVRGNISEIKTLCTGSGTTKGVDADAVDAVTEANLDDGVALVKAFARQAGCIIAVTGAIDLVSDGERCWCIRNGRAEMSRITGTGCQLSALMTAFLVANPDHKLAAAAAVVLLLLVVVGVVLARRRRRAPQDAELEHRRGRRRRRRRRRARPLFRRRDGRARRLPVEHRRLRRAGVAPRRRLMLLHHPFRHVVQIQLHHKAGKQSIEHLPIDRPLTQPNPKPKQKTKNLRRVHKLEQTATNLNDGLSSWLPLGLGIGAAWSLFQEEEPEEEEVEAGEGRLVLAVHLADHLSPSP